MLMSNADVTLVQPLMLMLMPVAQHGALEAVPRSLQVPHQARPEVPPQHMGPVVSPVTNAQVYRSPHR